MSDAHEQLVGAYCDLNGPQQVARGDQNRLTRRPVGSMHPPEVESDLVTPVNVLIVCHEVRGVRATFDGRTPRGANSERKGMRACPERLFGGRRPRLRWNEEDGHRQHRERERP